MTRNVTPQETVTVAKKVRTTLRQRAVVEEPPGRGHWQRQSFWVHTFQDAREHGRWVRVPRFYTSATAAQIASDIRSAHRRPLETVRVRGILPGEVWSARWDTDEKCPPGSFAIWIRLLSRNG